MSSNCATVNAAVLDREAVLKLLDGDVEFLKTLVEIYREDCPQQLAAMRQAIAQGDGAALAHAAHALKGSVGNFRAQAAYEAARQLELIGRAGDLAGAADACAALENELARLDPALTELLA